MVESTFKETTINDYVSAVHEKFPEMSEDDIKKILRFGFSRMYKFSMQGCDFSAICKDYGIFIYIGRAYENYGKMKSYYRIKLRKKIKSLYSYWKIKWSGYYYTYITKEEYKKYFSKRKIIKDRKYKFSGRVMFKVLDDCRLFYSKCKMFIKFEWYLDVGFTNLKEELIIKNPIIYEYDNTTQRYMNLLKTYNKYNLIDEEDSNKYI